MSEFTDLQDGIRRKDLRQVEEAARTLQVIALADALRILTLMAEEGDARYPRAAARWAARVTTEKGLSMGESRTVLALVETLPRHPAAVLPALRQYV